MLVGPGEPPVLSACKYVTPKKPGWGDVPKPAQSSPLGEDLEDMEDRVPLAACFLGAAGPMCSDSTGLRETRHKVTVSASQLRGPGSPGSLSSPPAQVQGSSEHVRAREAGPVQGPRRMAHGTRHTADGLRASDFRLPARRMHVRGRG